MDQTVLIALIAVVLVVVVLAAWMYRQKRGTGQKRRAGELRERFGPEYDRTVAEHGDPRRAQAELEARQQRVERLDIRSLSPSDQERFTQAWRATQARFVDDPSAAIVEADRLVTDVMTARGYPMGNFKQRAADISVDHPRVVENYRAAHDIALRHDDGEASTEDLRKAMVHYRALFEDLLETGVTDRSEVQRGEARG